MDSRFYSVNEDIVTMHSTEEATFLGNGIIFQKYQKDLTLKKGDIVVLEYIVVKLDKDMLYAIESDNLRYLTDVRVKGFYNKITYSFTYRGSKEEFNKLFTPVPEETMKVLYGR